MDENNLRAKEELLQKLKALPQFIETDLNPGGWDGTRYSGVMNILNGCFVAFSMGDIVTPGGKEKWGWTKKLYLIWQTDYLEEAPAHAVVLEESDIPKFLDAMKLQAKSLKS